MKIRVLRDSLNRLTYFHVFCMVFDVYGVPWGPWGTQGFPRALAPRGVLGILGREPLGSSPSVSPIPGNTETQDFFPCGHLRMSKNATFARYQTGTREHGLPIPESTATLICFQTGASGGLRGSRLLNIQDGTSGGDFPISESTATQVFFSLQAGTCEGHAIFA